MQSPWSKRLGDVARLIEFAHKTYFDPERFRLNLNNAIQTSRTVTFVLQKNKAKIPDYQHVYVDAVAAFGGDPIMKWLVDARNTIEKEGDLATHSQMRAKIIYSHLDDGPAVDARDDGLLFAGTRSLQKWWSTRLPVWAVENAAIAIDRRWVANSLPDHELTDALIHGYQRLRQLCEAVDAASGHVTGHAIDIPVRLLGSATHRTFIKLSDGIEYGLSSGPAPRMTKAAQKMVKARYGSFDGRFIVPGKTMAERVAAWADLACDVFNRDGYHLTMYVLLDTVADVVSAGVVQFADRVDKFLFSHQLGDLARTDPTVCGVIFVGEAWSRSQTIETFDGNIDAVPIVGETLGIRGVNAAGEECELMFDIDKISGKPRVDRSRPLAPSDGDTFFFAPVREAWAMRTKR
jgi:hypothetical protein